MEYKNIHHRCLRSIHHLVPHPQSQKDQISNESSSNRRISYHPHCHYFLIQVNKCSPVRLKMKWAQMSTSGTTYQSDHRSNQPAILSVQDKSNQVILDWIGNSTHSIFTVSPFLIVPAKGISGCHRLWSWGCCSAGVVSETGQMLRISERPMIGVGGLRLYRSRDTVVKCGLLGIGFDKQYEKVIERRKGR